MPRFILALVDGVLAVLRMGEPCPVTLRDGTAGETRTLTPIPPPNGAEPAAGAPLAPQRPRRHLPDVR